jgi:hypothetical protein
MRAVAATRSRVAGSRLQDEISTYERRFAELRPRLPAQGVVGYLDHPEQTGATPREVYIGYGRRGFERSDYRMALYYGLQAVAQVPWDPGGWGLLARIMRRLLARALLKRPPRDSADAKP